MWIVLVLVTQQHYAAHIWTARKCSKHWYTGSWWKDKESVMFSETEWYPTRYQSISCNRRLDWLVGCTLWWVEIGTNCFPKYDSKANVNVLSREAKPRNDASLKRDARPAWPADCLSFTQPEHPHTPHPPNAQAHTQRNPHSTTPDTLNSPRSIIPHHRSQWYRGEVMEVELGTMVQCKPSIRRSCTPTPISCCCRAGPALHVERSTNQRPAFLDRPIRASAAARSTWSETGDYKAVKLVSG